jgi:hypothetical protein
MKLGCFFSEIPSPGDVVLPATKMEFEYVLVVYNEESREPMNAMPCLMVHFLNIPSL